MYFCFYTPIYALVSRVTSFHDVSLLNCIRVHVLPVLAAYSTRAKLIQAEGDPQTYSFYLD